MQQRQTANEIYVHPTQGNDTASGNSMMPLKTLTQALQRVKSGMVIQLSRGTYSTDNGEVFPLRLPSDVLVAGNVAAQGAGVIIQGSGIYQSQTFGAQNVTLVLEGSAQLRGVTVTNSAAKGTGIWIESAAATVAGCTLAQCSREGILVTGTADPLITNCIFHSNVASGLTLVRNSRGEIRSNLMQLNGFGIAISDRAAALIVSNQMFENRCGIVISGSASPILRGNILTRNQEDGLVISGKANPDFGKPYDPASNRFGENHRFDLRNTTALPLISTGNQLNLAHVSGPVELLTTHLPSAAEFSLEHSKPVITSHWAMPMVQFLLEQNMISDGTFQPEATLTGNEFANWMQRAGLNQPDSDQHNRSDTAQGLSRLEAIQHLVKAAGLTGGQPSLVGAFRDRAQVPTAQILTVATALQHQLIVSPTPDSLNPLHSISQAEAAAMLYQTLVAKGQADPVADAALLPTLGKIRLHIPKPNEQPPVVVLDPGHGGRDAGMTTKLKTAEAQMLEMAGSMSPFMEMQAMSMPTMPMSPLPSGGLPTELPGMSGMSSNMLSELLPVGTPADQPEMPSLEEKTVVLSVAQAVASFLQQQGVQVILTRTDDRELSLAERLAIAKQHQADAFVSLHANASLTNQAEINGVETYYNPNSAAGTCLSWAIHKALTRMTDIMDRGVHKATFLTLREAAIPAAHVEVGYITGSQDAPSLGNLAYHRYLARPISNGILRYLRQRHWVN